MDCPCCGERLIKAGQSYGNTTLECPACLYIEDVPNKERKKPLVKEKKEKRWTPQCY
jgi:DNA-directed RNA polymerase subunit M/transcription elongation factor TFIIS